MSILELVRRLMFRPRSSSTLDRLALCRSCGNKPVEPGTAGQCGECYRRELRAGGRG